MTNKHSAIDKVDEIIALYRATHKRNKQRGILNFQQAQELIEERDKMEDTTLRIGKTTIQIDGYSYRDLDALFDELILAEDKVGYLMDAKKRNGESDAE